MTAASRSVSLLHCALCLLRLIGDDFAAGLHILSQAFDRVAGGEREEESDGGQSGDAGHGGLVLVLGRK